MESLINNIANCGMWQKIVLNATRHYITINNTILGDLGIIVGV